MRETDDGRLEWGSARKELVDQHNTLIDAYNKLIRRHNRLVRERWPRPTGRPLGASETQAGEVTKRRKAGESIRAIAYTMGLGVSTVRTVVKGVKRAKEQRRKEFDRMRAAQFRVRKKQLDRLPDKITDLRKSGEALAKAAKGLGSR
jgi:hypothetical protein